MSKQLDLSLYVITDENLLNDRNIGKSVEEAILGGATVIQYRAKNKDTRDMYKEATIVKKICDKHGVTFLVNDRIDLALAVNSDGVHIGQEDLPPEVARRLLGFDKIIGYSTKNIEQVIEANSLPIDYIGFGSIFPTKTKKDAILNSIETLKKVLNLSIQPVVAIGGINKDNIDEVLNVGCKNVAVVSAVFKDKNILENTRALKEKLKRKKRF